MNPSAAVPEQAVEVKPTLHDSAKEALQQGLTNQAELDRLFPGV
jgi:hypothetical protein